MQTATIDSIRATNDEELAQMVQLLQHQSETRRDYVVPAKDVSAVISEEGEVDFTFSAGKDAPPVMYRPTLRAHETIWYRMDIPKAYYLRMGDTAQDLLVENINYWMERSDKNFLARTIDDKVRAFMSDRFRILDSTELFFTTFKRAKDLNAKIVQADLTENNFYMKILRPDYAQKVEDFKHDVWERKTKRPGGSLYHVLDHLEEDGGQWLVPGVSISNSDVGAGSLSANMFIFDTICWNGLIHNKAIHQVHLGKQLDVGFISMETRNLEDQATWSKVNDMLTAALGDEKAFLALIQKIKETGQMPLEEPVAAVDTVVQNFGFSDEDKQAILNELVSAGSNTVRGLLAAVTAVGRDRQDYEEGRRFEIAGGDILDNPVEFSRVKRTARTARQIQKES